MKRAIALLLILSLILVGCGNNVPQDSSESAKNTTETTESVVDDTEVETATDSIRTDEEGDSTPYEYLVDFDSLNDEELNRYITDNIYSTLVADLDSDEYYVDNVEAVYVSQEYIDELTYNSQSNIYFGYTLKDLDEQFQGKRYVFTLGEDGNTIVTEFENYDDTYEQVIKNVAIGAGVILICVTVSVVTGGVGAPAVSMIFAAAAKTGTVMALSSGVIGGVSSGIVTGIQTGDMSQAVKAAALDGSEAFKWGAITGAVSGGAGEAFALHGATLNGLSMNEAATIQKESGYPLKVISEFHSTEEYEVFKAANLKSQLINGKSALIRTDIDLNIVDDLGRTNLERMQQGLAALDSNGVPFELHHIGQEADGTLAILTQAEHDNAVLHGFKNISEIDRKVFNKQRSQFWKTMAKVLVEGGI